MKDARQCTLVCEMHRKEEILVSVMERNGILQVNEQSLNSRFFFKFFMQTF